MSSISAPLAIPASERERASHELSMEASFGFPFSPSPPNSWSERLYQRAKRWGERDISSARAPYAASKVGSAS